MSYWIVNNDELYHHGVKGQKWGVRRYQNPDGTLTEEGKKRYGTVENFNKAQRRKKIAIGVGAGVGGTLAIGAAVILGKQYLTNRKLIESHDRAIEDLDQNISDDKEMIKYYVNKLDEAEKDVELSKKVNTEQLSKEIRRHGENTMNEFSKAANNEDFGRGLLYGTRMTAWDAVEYEARKLNSDPTSSSRRDSVAKNLYKSNKEQEKMQRAYDLKRKIETAESRRLDASLNVQGYTEQLKKDRRDKRDYEDAQNYFKKHPLATKLPKTLR